ncbi:MAG: AfsR/SARP family transcriptional regulator [Betaproteobacteria bacterium]
MAKLSVVTADGSPRSLAEALSELAEERFNALEGLIALAEAAYAREVPHVAQGAAGLVIAAEHLRATLYEHSTRARALLQLGRLPARPRSAEEFLACTGAVICEAYGTWPEDDRAPLRECVLAWVTSIRTVSAMRLSADVILLWACALGEWCERNGEAGDFEGIAAVAEQAELDPDAAPWLRAHWYVVRAWHLQAFGHVKQTEAELLRAERLAHEAGLPALEAMVWLQQARLVLWRANGERAREVAALAASRGDVLRTPIWLADQSDAECRVALFAGDYVQALAHARRAAALLGMSGSPPSYGVTYGVSEAYALIGIGSFDRANELLAELATRPLPPYLARRLAVVMSLSMLAGEDAQGRWTERSDRMLREVMRELRELEWPNVFTFLPRQIARLFARALDAGIEAAWVVNAIQMRDLAPPALASPTWPWPVRLRLLGGFECEVEGRPVASGSIKAAAKPLALLRRIAVLAGYEGVSADSVSRGLWPGEGRGGREKVLETTLARLRKLLGCADAVLLHEHRLRLNPRRVWLDMAMLTGELDALRDPGAGELRWRVIFGLYRGPLLDDETDVWITPWRDRLRGLLAASLLTARDTPGDRERWLRACAADPALASQRPG